MVIKKFIKKSYCLFRLWFYPPFAVIYGKVSFHMNLNQNLEHVNSAVCTNFSHYLETKWGTWSWCFEFFCSVASENSVKIVWFCDKNEKNETHPLEQASGVLADVCEAGDDIVQIKVAEGGVVLTLPPDLEMTERNMFFFYKMEYESNKCWCTCLSSDLEKLFLCWI